MSLTGKLILILRDNSYEFFLNNIFVQFNFVLFVSIPLLKPNNC